MILPLFPSFLSTPISVPKWEVVHNFYNPFVVHTESYPWKKYEPFPPFSSHSYFRTKKERNETLSTLHSSPLHHRTLFLPLKKRNGTKPYLLCRVMVFSTTFNNVSVISWRFYFVYFSLTSQNINFTPEKIKGAELPLYINILRFSVKSQNIDDLFC